MKALFELIDLNGDGRIDFNELLAWQLQRYRRERKRGKDDHARANSRIAQETTMQAMFARGRRRRSVEGGSRQSVPDEVDGAAIDPAPPALRASIAAADAVAAWAARPAASGH